MSETTGNGPNHVRGVIGAVAGGVLGVIAFALLLELGLYGMVVPGAMVGWACRAQSGCRSVPLGIVSAIDHGPFYPKIQTDAAINYGNSGGALINSKGQVIGISRSKFSVGKSDEIGINFGVPIDIVKDVFHDIKENGRVIRNWLGIKTMQLKQVQHQNLDPGVDFGVGLFIIGIEPGSPSAESGLKIEDLLIRFDGHLVKGPVEFKTLFLATPIGQEVEIEVIRDKKPVTLILKLRERPVK